MTVHDVAGDVPPEAIVEDAERAIEQLKAMRSAISRVVFGQEKVIEQTLATLLSGGHALLVGVPGLGKTLLVETIGVVTDLDAARVQFTPDLMPSDILGSEVLHVGDDGERSFRFIKGPIFTQLLTADEINRASPRTQSALLQAMQENQVSIAGTTNDLPKPFHVLATQNPIEQEGTYPLPEAQLDRFLMQIDVKYPDLDTEYQILTETTGAKTASTEPVIKCEDLMRMQDLVRRMPVGKSVADAILTLVRSARPGGPDGESVSDLISWGAGPRASQAFMIAIRARALLDGRFAPSVDDVLALAQPILQHRMSLTYGARADGHTLTSVIDTLCDPLR